jgi:hypothetical protein
MPAGLGPVTIIVQILRAVAEPLSNVQALDQDLTVTLHTAFYENSILTVILHPAIAGCQVGHGVCQLR